MTDLDFNLERPALIWYVADRVMLAETGDSRAISFIEFMWDHDPDSLADAYELIRQEGWLDER